MSKTPEAAVEARIAHIQELMRSLKFVRGETTRQLAKEWGLCLQRVQEISAIASKRALAEVRDPARVTVTVSEMIERTMFAAHDDAERLAEAGLDPSKARKVVIDAGKTWAMVTGAMAPKKLSVEVNEGMPESPSERAKFFRALAEREEAKLLKGEE